MASMLASEHAREPRSETPPALSGESSSERRRRHGRRARLYAWALTTSVVFRHRTRTPR
jgi:hypothetical protein